MNELLRKLELVKSVHFSDWNTTQELIKTISNDSTEIVEIDDHRDDFLSKILPNY